MATERDSRQGARRRIRTLDYLRIAFSAAAVGLIIFGLFTMRETSRSRGWARTAGRVVTSNVNEFTGTGGTTWRPMIIYSYSVGAVRFMSSRVAFHSLASGNRGDAAKVASRYPAGSTVAVLYDPQDPEQAVLQPGSNPWVPLLAGGVFSMLAVWMRMLRGRAEKRQGRNQ
jgi:hypothetical protein